jgi:hypothetical protein
MTLPFTAEQFFGVFAEYNRTMSWIVLALWGAALAAAGTAFRDPVRGSRPLTWYLATLWLWNAVAYHAMLFARINPVAWLFAGLFVLQAILLALAATHNRLAYFAIRGWRQQVGAMLVVYALLYPLLNITLGHGYPAAPTFGVPCPTAILTIGLLLTTRGPARTWLLITPVIWGFIAASAALQLGVWADYLLVAAAVLGTVDVVSTMIRGTPRSTRALTPVSGRQWQP